MTYDDLQSVLKSSYPHQVGCNMFIRQRAGMQLARMGLRKGKDFRRSDGRMSFIALDWSNNNDLTNDQYFFKNESDALVFKLWIPTNKEEIMRGCRNELKNHIDSAMKSFAKSLVSVQPMIAPTGHIFTLRNKIP